VIDHKMASRIEALHKKNGYSSEDFNACQVTWTVRQLKETDSDSQFRPHEITFQYENQQVIKMINRRDGHEESIQGLGINCLEFNNHVYIFFDTLDYGTRFKFNLSDLSYVIYSSDKGRSWSGMKSLHPFSVKAKFILPHDRFGRYVKIFGNKDDHVLSIFNRQDETTYLFSAEFDILKTVSVYNRLSGFDYPSDFHWHNNILYLARGSCEKIRGRIQCPSRTYVETSEDFGRSWGREVFPFVKKSYFLTLNGSLYQFYSLSCPNSWFGLIPAINRAYTCGYIRTRKLDDNGRWEEPKILLETASKLFGIYKDENPILVWQDLRFHKRRSCGFIPVIGCIDSTPTRGPTAIYAGELDVANWRLDESIIKYEN